MVLMASMVVQGVWTVSECARMIMCGKCLCVPLDDFVISRLRAPKSKVSVSQKSVSLGSQMSQPGNIARSSGPSDTW